MLLFTWVFVLVVCCDTEFAFLCDFVMVCGWCCFVIWCLVGFGVLGCFVFWILCVGVFVSLCSVLAVAGLVLVLFFILLFRLVFAYVVWILWCSDACYFGYFRGMLFLLLVGLWLFGFLFRVLYFDGFAWVCFFGLCVVFCWRLVSCLF